MNTLHFSRDGILRRAFTSRDPAKIATERYTTRYIPLRAWEGSADPDVFLKSLHDVIVFEPGLTVEELFENMSPWADTMRGVACMDFPAFLEEMRTTAEKPDDEIELISLAFRAEISVVPRFDRKGAVVKKGVFNIGRPAHTGRLSLEEGWHMDAMLKEASRANYDGAQSVSLSFSPLSEWKHLPIVIHDKASIRDSTACKHNTVYLGTEQSLTAQDHQNVTVNRNSSGAVLGHDIAIDPPSPTFFDALVRGFLWDVGFHYSPFQRDDCRDSVIGAMDELNDIDDIDDLEVEVDDGNEIDAEAVADMKMMELLEAKSSEMGLLVTQRKHLDA